MCILPEKPRFVETPNGSMCYADLFDLL